MPEAYDWQGAPVSGNWEEAARVAQQQQAPVWTPDNSWDAGTTQYNAMTGEYVEPPKPQNPEQYKKLGDNLVDYFGSVNQDTKNKYEQGFTGEATLQQALNSGPYVGDGGFVFNGDGSAGDATQATAQTIRDFNGDGVVNGSEAIDNLRWIGDNSDNGRDWNSMDARAQYMTPEVARWYADNGYVDPAKLDAYNAWVDQAVKDKTEALPKSLAEGEYGFKQYNRNAGDKVWNDINGANNAMQSALGDLATARSDNAVYKATHEDGTESDVSKEIRNELYDQLEARTKNPMYELPSGERMSLEDINKSEVTNQGTHVFFGDVYAGELDEVLTPDYTALLDTALKSANAPIVTSDNAVWTDKDIIDNVPEDRILQWLIDPNTQRAQVADAVNELKKNAGSKANYGLFGWNKPAEQSGDILSELGKGNILPQMADIAASSAAYFNPFTMIPVGAGQVLGMAQGVNTQGRNQSKFGTVENPGIAAPMQALATVGESVLGGRAVGRAGLKNSDEAVRGVYETLGDWLAKRGVIPEAAMKSQNPLARMAREGTFEGLEEVTTSPLYEIAENAQNAYANNELDQYGYETNEKDANTSFWDRMQNAAAQAPQDFVGGALLGGPMEGGSMLRNRKDTGRRWNDYKLSKQLGFDVPEIEDWMKTNRS